jgi:hypothetical protein
LKLDEFVDVSVVVGVVDVVVVVVVVVAGGGVSVLVALIFDFVSAMLTLNGLPRI